MHTWLKAHWQWRWLSDARLLLWLFALVLLVLSEPGCAEYFRLHNKAGALQLRPAPEALRVPGLLLATSVTGALLAWSGRSVLNGAYLAACLLLATLSALWLLHRSLFLVVLTPESLQLRNGIDWWSAGTLRRHDYAATQWQTDHGPHSQRHYPVLLDRQGQRLYLRRNDGAERIVLAYLREQWQVAVPLETSQAAGCSRKGVSP